MELEGISTKMYIQKHILCLKPHNLWDKSMN